MKRRSRRSSDEPPSRFVFDENAADEAVRFVESLELREGNQPFVLLGWQREVLRQLFGWRERSTGRRRYRRVSIWIPRGNGKTPFAAALAMVLLFLSGETAAEIYSVAADREQAQISFEDGAHMVRSSETLADLSTTYRRSLTYSRNKSTWKVMSSDARTKHGYRPFAVIFDELHTQQKRELWDAMKTGLGKGKRDTLLITTSTAGVYDPESLGFTEYAYACKVRDGLVEDPHYLAVIFEAPASVATDSTWASPEVWEACNPGLGVTVQRTALEGEALQASEDPAALASFLQLRLNVWVNAAVAAIHPEHWAKCQRPELIVDRPLAYGGLDVGEVDDLASLALCVPHANGEFSFHVETFMSESKARALKDKHGVDYPLWMSQGWIIPSGVNYVDVEDIRARFVALNKIYKIKQIAFDPWQARQVALRMQDDDRLPVVEVPQTMKHQSEPTKEFLRLLADGKLRFGESPVLRWMASNLVLFRDGKANVVAQKQSKAAKIDGMVASINAFGRAVLSEQKKPVTPNVGFV